MQKLALPLAMLTKVRHYVAKTEFKTYITLYVNGYQIRFQSNLQFIKDRIKKLQKKTLGVIFFADFQARSSPLFTKWKILKIKDLVEMQNILLVHSFLKGELPKSFGIFSQI